MKLLTKAIENKIPALYAQDGKGNEAIVHAKFFNPVGAQTWYATEYSPETKTFFGLVDFHADMSEAELGYFSLTELEEIRLPYGMKIERDINFESKTLGEVRNG